MTLDWKRIGGDGPHMYDNFLGMDPALNWLLGPGKGAFLPPGNEPISVPSILYFPGFPTGYLNTLRVLLDGYGDDDAPAVPTWVPVLRALKTYLQQLGAGGTGALQIPKWVFDDLAGPHPNEALLTFFRTLMPSLGFTPPHDRASFSAKHNWPDPNALAFPPATIPVCGWPDGTVVMGVIDDAIGFAHEAFRNSAGESRVQYWWQQDGSGPASERTVWFGTEIGKNAFQATYERRPGIDELLITSEMDDARVYREVGLADFARGQRASAMLARSHGTHVLDIAAGYDPDDAMGAKRPIVAVQLPSEVVARSSGAELDYYVIAAVDYILHRAEQLRGLGPKLPVVINMSYGFTAGPHDGTTPLEVAIDQRLTQYGPQAQMVLSAGNSHLSRCHAEFAFSAGTDMVELDWMVQPDDRTSSSLEIWLPYDAAIKPPADITEQLIDPRIRVSVISPQGVESEPLPGRQGITTRLVRDGSILDADAAAEIKYGYVTGQTQRGMFRITLAPTEHLAGEPGPWAGHALAPAGIWKVRIHRAALAYGAVVNAWIQRDDTIYGYPPGGRQSFFVNPCYARYDDQGRPIADDADADQGCAVRRRSLVSAVATGERVVVAGAYRKLDRRITDYSAGGPVAPMPEQAQPPRKPDALMAAETARRHRGTLGAGTLTGSVTRMGGTSVAAPALSRWLAGHPDLGTRGGRELVKEAAEMGEAAGGAFEHAPPIDDERGGWGRIEPLPGRLRVRRVES